MARKKKAQLRVGRVVVCAVALVAVIFGLVVLFHHIFPACHSGGEEKNPRETVDLSEITAEGEYLKIVNKDCSAYVGSVILLTCKAEPESLLNQVNYSSTDESVLTVTGNGRVEVVGTGLAAIVAVSGVYSDTIIIRGITEEETPDSDYPMIGETTSTEEGNADPKGGEADTGKEKETAGNGSDQENSGEEGKTTENAKEETTKAVTTEAEETAGGGSSAQTVEPSQKEGDEVDESVILAERAESVGFSFYAEGTYVYREDGNYLGEIIVSDDKLQIYLKTRTSTFDQAIKDLLASILPKNYETAFAQLIGASSTSTVSIDGHLVRAIISSDEQESHRQLIVYYE